MEGVGARLGRSSTRYGGPATVFTGRVRKWKKKWVPLPNPNLNNSSSNHNHNHNNSSNGSNNSNNSSHLLVYKWTPLSRDPSAAADDDNDNVAADPPRKKLRYVPIAVIEEQKQEEEEEEDAVVAVKSDDEEEAKKKQAEAVDVKEEGLEEDEALDKDVAAAEGVNETNLDLNLGAKSS